MKRYLGIDLGGCMSGTSAYCLIEGDGESFKIVENFKEPKHKDYQSCHDFLLKTMLNAEASIIAIDAPLSLPRKLYDVNFRPEKREALGEIANPYLFRFTDYYLFQTYGLRPMPPAGDRIGRLTARAMQLLQSQEIEPVKAAICEVYPKQIAQALGFVNYKKEPKQVLDFFHLQEEGFDDHQVDALLAAFTAMKIDFGQTVYPLDENEGWCYPLKLEGR